MRWGIRRLWSIQDCGGGESLRAERGDGVSQSRMGVGGWRKRYGVGVGVDDGRGHENR